MSFHAHFRCDGCEDALHVEDESELYEKGWVVLAFGEVEDSRHFCSLPCIMRWSDSDLAREAVEAATHPEEE